MTQFPCVVIQGGVLVVGTCDGTFTPANPAPPTPPPPPKALAVATTSLPSAKPGTPYSVKLAATGGTAPYQWAIQPGQGGVPAGMTLHLDGTIDGTPPTGHPEWNIPGTFSVFVLVKDSTGATATATLTLNVGSNPTSTHPSQLGTYQLGTS